MKKITKIVALVLFAIMVISPMVQGSLFAQEYKLSDDPRLNEAKESFQEGLKYEEKGAQEFRRRPGQSQKYYEHAEDYFLKASFIYREVGEKLGIDTASDVLLCNKKQREMHVLVGKARKKRGRVGSAF